MSSNILIDFFELAKETADKSQQSAANCVILTLVGVKPLTYQDTLFSTDWSSVYQLGHKSICR